MKGLKHSLNTQQTVFNEAAVLAQWSIGKGNRYRLRVACGFINPQLATVTYHSYY